MQDPGIRQGIAASRESRPESACDPDDVLHAKREVPRRARIVRSLPQTGCRWRTPGRVRPRRARPEIVVEALVERIDLKALLRRPSQDMRKPYRCERCARSDRRALSATSNAGLRFSPAHGRSSDGVQSGGRRAGSDREYPARERGGTRSRALGSSRCVPRPQALERSVQVAGRFYHIRQQRGIERPADGGQRPEEAGDLPSAACLPSQTAGSADFLRNAAFHDRGVEIRLADATRTASRLDQEIQEFSPNSGLPSARSVTCSIKVCGSDGAAQPGSCTSAFMSSSAVSGEGRVSSHPACQATPADIRDVGCRTTNRFGGARLPTRLAIRPSEAVDPVNIPGVAGRLSCRRSAPRAGRQQVSRPQSDQHAVETCECAGRRFEAEKVQQQAEVLRRTSAAGEGPPRASLRSRRAYHRSQSGKRHARLRGRAGTARPGRPPNNVPARSAPRRVAGAA